MLLLRSYYLYICISCFFFHQRWSTLTTPIFKHQSPGAQQMDSLETYKAYDKNMLWRLVNLLKRHRSLHGLDSKEYLARWNDHHQKSPYLAMIEFDFRMMWRWRRLLSTLADCFIFHSKRQNKLTSSYTFFLTLTYFSARFQDIKQIRFLADTPQKEDNIHRAIFIEYLCISSVQF